MKCDLVQSELSEHLDGSRLRPASRRHLESCTDCDGFLSSSIAFADRYKAQIERGLARLRVEPVERKSRRSPAAVVGVAAALLLLAIPRTEVAVAPPPSEPAWVRLYDDVPPVAEITLPLVWIPDSFLPVRLEQDLLPPAEVDVVAILPPGMRF